jgi:hypothetical protein
MFDWREVERLLCDSFILSKSIGHYHGFLPKRNYSGRVMTIYEWSHDRESSFFSTFFLSTCNNNTIDD